MAAPPLPAVAQWSPMYEQDVQRRLLADVTATRRAIRNYLHKKSPRKNRLATVCIVSSALAAAMTVGPAAGGNPFIENVQVLLGLPEAELAGRLLCLVAVIVSVVSVIAANLSKASELPRRVATAETCRADIDGIEKALIFNSVSTDEAVKRYLEVVAKVSFIDRGQPTSATNPY